MVLLTLTVLQHLGDVVPADVVLRAEGAASTRAGLAAANRASRDRRPGGVGGVTLEDSVTASPATTVPLPTTAAPRPAPVAALVAVRPRPTTPTTAATAATTTKKARPKPTTTTAPTTTTTAPATTTTAPRPANVEEGLASWYEAALPGTCAHRSSPKGTVLTVVNVADRSRISCRVADRGPYVDGRIVDLAKADFSLLAHAGEGVIRVRVEW